MINKMIVLMEQVENVVSGGTNRGLLILSDNQFLKTQIEKFLGDKEKSYQWILGNMTLENFFKKLSTDDILVFDGLNYNKRGIDGLLYQSVESPIGKAVEVKFKKKKVEFNGRIILFGTALMNPYIQRYFSVWIE